MPPKLAFFKQTTNGHDADLVGSVLILAGEASGDYHAAALVQEVRRRFPKISFTGIGGEKLEAAGMRLLFHYRDINTIGFSGGFGKLKSVLAAYIFMKSELRGGKYDVFIPVDFPDVNIRLCNVAKKAGVKVCYYISPQIWAWRRHRIHKIAAVVDRMMTIFPFEEKLYSDVGVQANFVGHTMVSDIPEEVDKSALKLELGIRNQGSVVTLAPGSRHSEIARVLPAMCSAAELHRKVFPETQFVVPLAGPHLRGQIQNILDDSRFNAMVIPAEASKIMAVSDYGLVTSGTATLQAALSRMPHAVVYILDTFSWILATKILMPLLMEPDIHVAIANMLCIKGQAGPDNPIEIMIKGGYRVPCLGCGRPLLVPEVLQQFATPENLASWLERFRRDSNLRATMKKAFVRLREMLEPLPSNPSPSDALLDLILEKRGETTQLEF